MSARSLVLKFITFLIFVLWAVYIYVLGDSLFSEIYKRPCTEVTVPIVVYSFIVGCLSFVTFIVFRVYAGFHPFAELLKPTDNSKVTYVAHTMAAFICLTATQLSFTNLKTAQCQNFDPPVLPMILVSIVNVANGFLSNEQFSAPQPPQLIVTMPDNLDVEISGLIGEQAENYRSVTVAPATPISTIPKTD